MLARKDMDVNEHKRQLHTKGSLKHLSNSKSALDMPFFLK
jgi:hypothetical protein